MAGEGRPSMTSPYRTGNADNAQARFGHDRAAQTGYLFRNGI
jgi:hypothetical protein